MSSAVSLRIDFPVAGTLGLMRGDNVCLLVVVDFFSVVERRVLGLGVVISVGVGVGFIVAFVVVVLFSGVV